MLRLSRLFAWWNALAFGFRGFTVRRRRFLRSRACGRFLRRTQSWLVLGSVFACSISSRCLGGQRNHARRRTSHILQFVKAVVSNAHKNTFLLTIQRLYGDTEV